MSKLTRLLAATAFAVLALFAFASAASAQATVDTTPAVGGEGYVLPASTVQVQGATQVQPSGALPYTGSDSLPMVQIGVALVAAGAIVTFAVRRHNAAAKA